MNGLVTTGRFARCASLPLSLAETELRAGGVITVASLDLKFGQRLELRSLTLHLVNILTPGVVTDYRSSALGLCSAGLYQGTMLTGALALTTSQGSVTTVNPFAVCVAETPGTYTVRVSNNTNNLDLAVAVTGTAKLFY
jgi:hypothetical protein